MYEQLEERLEVYKLVVRHRRVELFGARQIAAAGTGGKLIPGRC